MWSRPRGLARRAQNLPESGAPPQHHPAPAGRHGPFPDELLDRYTTSGPAAPGTGTAAPGAALPAALRSRMESALGGDFSRVRVHSAGQGPQELGARAWALGDRITFARGEYRPGTREGDALLAHELTHTLQQEGSPDTGTVSEAEHPLLEHEAHLSAAAAGSASQAGRISRLAGRRVQRHKPGEALSVVPSLADSDRTRRWFDPADRQVKPVWTPEAGYVRNPSAAKLSTVVVKGRLGRGFENGTFMYAVDKNGDVWIGKRLAEPGAGPGRATGLPHPALIGGKDPVVLAAGETEVRGGRIYRIDNQSGHFQPPRSSLGTSIKEFFKLPTSAFHPEFAAESVHFGPGGVRTTRSFRSLDMLRLRLRDFKGALKLLRPRAIAGRLRSRSFRAGAKTLGALVAMLVLQYLMSKLMESLTEKFIEQQIRDLAPKVESGLAAKGDQLDALLLEDSDADFYINVQFTIQTTDIPVPDDYSTITSMPLVDLGEMGFSRQPWDATPVESTQLNCGTTSHTTVFTVSEPFSPRDLLAPGSEAPAVDTAPSKE
ncbi:hypothetical protein GCM10010193_18200 [Kitasatospora atroaurantiaca]|uniref:Uncharacterized protein DUF4157 n=1 Tax=Kitasatospora atroaurantiaca TaxID=285545 RepID=A0A561F026_9ACTN|nr:DUF4157 domain-containing protein [Kitasatospora atroaurantiaca]TWE21213.1 uncharacterized protein DUF4157 [Kitasatospora atroaurantiaca]